MVSVVGSLTVALSQSAYDGPPGGLPDQVHEGHVIFRTVFAVEAFWVSEPA